MKPWHRPELAIIDDEPNFRESLRMALEDVFVVSTAGTVGEARELLKTSAPDAVLLDIMLPDGDGLGFLKEMKDLRPMPVVIIMTAFATVDSAVKALKQGAVDYFTKPFDIERLKRELNVYLENRALQEKVIELDREIKKILPSFITSGSGKMKDIVDRAPMIAPLSIPVLIKGETGTGKEKLANWIHALSGVKGEMVAINCSALPREILESELFGYVKGAFSGAAGSKEGLIERAEDGTLFLDEIGELPEDVQAKFLRVLEDGVYYKVGDPKERKVRFRLIAATNKDLTGKDIRFRTDLYYRINGVTFELVPLRERRHDIPLLVAAFVKEANYASNKNVAGLTVKAMECLNEYGWPGNIRELKWCIHRAVAVAKGDAVDIGEISLSSEAFKSLKDGEPIAGEVSFNDAMERLEKKYIEDALKAFNNNKTASAKALNLSVRALHYKIKKYNIQ
ncbi:sigma-54-dependent Fis family transcriptional regulator [bacterium]|nr:MAG: sigma-54-dependent Fis family transcriptional regulator [bacterium]